MTATPIVDDLTTDGRAAGTPARRTTGGGVVVTAGRRPSPVPRRARVPRPDPAHATAFGQGCLDDEPADQVGGGLAGIVEAARREAGALGHGRIGTEHLLLAVLRAGGEVGRAFGLRRAGVAVVAAACAAAPVIEPLLATDGTPAPTAAAQAALDRAGRRAAARGRRPGTADLGLALLAAGRSARLLADLGVDADDLADVLACNDVVLSTTAGGDDRPGPAGSAARSWAAGPAPVATPPPVRLVPPAPAEPPAVVPAATARAGALTAPLRIGPPPGSPARRLGRGRVGPVARPHDDPPLDLPA